VHIQFETMLEFAHANTTRRRDCFPLHEYQSLLGEEDPCSKNRAIRDEKSTTKSQRLAMVPARKFPPHHENPFAYRATSKRVIIIWSSQKRMQNNHRDVGVSRDTVAMLRSLAPLNQNTAQTKYMNRFQPGSSTNGLLYVYL